MNRQMKKQMTTHGAILTGGVLLVLALTGCSSDAPTDVDLMSPATRDSSPPAPPTGLSAAAAGSRVKVAWLPNTEDQDLAGYMLYRVAFGQDWPLLEAPSLATSYLDTSPLTRPCHYAVVAVDINGNESARLEIPFQGIPDRPDFNRD